MFTEIASNVYSVDSRFVDGKNGIILGQRGAVAIDASNFPDEAQAMADFIRDQGYTPSRLILTHGHGDHILGSGIFKGTDVIAHDLTPVEMLRLLPESAKRLNISVDALRDQLAWPSITFSDELYVDLGGKHLHIFPTPGHSQDGVSIYLPEDRLLFAGDSVVTSIVPAIANGDSRILQASLARLMALDIEIMVPGHGSVVYGQAQVQDWLSWISTYLSRVRGAVQEGLAKGLTEVALLDSIDFDTYIGVKLPKDRHKMPSRHRDSVRKIIEEVWKENSNDI